MALESLPLDRHFFKPMRPPVLLELLRVVRDDERFDWKSPFKTAAFILAHPKLTANWLRFLSHPPMPGVWHDEPRLIDKPLRPYMNARWSAKQRVEAIQFHYRWLHANWNSPSLKHLFDGHPLEFARWMLPGENRQVSLRLEYCGSFEREGDLTLALYIVAGHPEVSDHLPLLSMTFSMVSIEGKASLCIGCVQARNDPQTKELLATLTKAQHGLRPKSLLVDVARSLARHWDLDLYGISPDAHPFTSLRYRLSARKRLSLQSMKAAYLDLWSDQGGVWCAGGWLRLSTTLQGRETADIPSRKRSMYARRAAWYADVQLQINIAVASTEQNKTPQSFD